MFAGAEVFEDQKELLTASRFRSQTLNPLLLPMSPHSEGGKKDLSSDPFLVIEEWRGTQSRCYISAKYFEDLFFFPLKDQSLIH